MTGSPVFAGPSRAGAEAPRDPLLAIEAVARLAVTQRQIIERFLPLLPPGATMRDCVVLLAEKRGTVAVVDDDDTLLGVVTAGDLTRLMERNEGFFDVPVADVMTSAPRTVTTETTLFEATNLMDEGGYRRLPVVDADGRAVGIVDVKTVTHFLVEHFPEAVYNQASHAQLLARHREGA